MFYANLAFFFADQKNTKKSLEKDGFWRWRMDGILCWLRSRIVIVAKGCLFGRYCTRCHLWTLNYGKKYTQHRGLPFFHWSDAIYPSGNAIQYFNVFTKMPKKIFNKDHDVLHNITIYFSVYQLFDVHWFHFSPKYTMCTT